MNQNWISREELDRHLAEEQAKRKAKAALQGKKKIPHKPKHQKGKSK